MTEVVLIKRQFWAISSGQQTKYSTEHSRALGLHCQLAKARQYAQFEATQIKHALPQLLILASSECDPTEEMRAPPADEEIARKRRFHALPSCAQRTGVHLLARASNTIAWVARSWQTASWQPCAASQPAVQPARECARACAAPQPRTRAASALSSAELSALASGGGGGACASGVHIRPKQQDY